MKSLKKLGIAIEFIILLTIFNSFGYSTLEAQRALYSNPIWAPAYYPGVRYYYIPDIETFYDLSDQDFVYLDNGQWLFSNELPPVYSGFDLFDAYIIALNVDVFQPWMHFHFYVSNYPRFYYRSLYSDADIRDIRGFNENEHKPFYWTQEDRTRMNELRQNSHVDRRMGSSRPPQKPNYYGKNIGRPVRVQQQMRENRQASRGQRRR